MADVNMELDVTHPAGLDGHMDDDLIDYDDDDVEISGTTWKTHQIPLDNDQNLIEEDDSMQLQSDQGNSYPSTQTMQDKPSSPAGEDIMVEHELVPDNDTIMSTSHIAEASAREFTTTVTSPHVEIHHVEVHDATKIPQFQPEGVNHTGSVSPNEKQNVDEKEEIDEIDYDDDGDDGNEGDARSDLLHPAAQQSLPPANEKEPSQNESNESYVSKDNQISGQGTDNDVADNNHNPDENAKDGDEHEITWEDNGDEAENGTVDENPNTVAHTLSDQADSQNLAHEAENSGLSSPAPNPQQGSTEWDDKANDNEGQGAVVESGDDVEDGHEQLEHSQYEAHEDYAEAEQDDDTEVDGKSSDQHDDDSHFPAVTVVYKGDEYPLVSTSSDAFFSDASVEDLPLKDLLAHFRDVLGEDITPTEELMFKVDELGLEFSETSPDDLINNHTLRGVLDIFDVLVRNQDPDTSRVLYTYLYVKPNVAKRLEFLTESAANGIGLDEVIYLFEPPQAHGSSTNQTLAGGEDEEVRDEEEFRGEEDDGQLEPYADTDHGNDYGEPADDYEEGGHASDNGVEKNHQPEAEQTDEPGESNTAEGIDASAEEPSFDVTVNPPTIPESVGNGVAFDDDKIDFNLGTATTTITTTADDAELEDSFVDKPVHHPVNSTGRAGSATATQDELDFALDQADGTSLAEKDEDLLSEIDWQDPSAPNDEAQEGTPTPSSATKRSRPEDEVDLDVQQDAKRLRS